MKRCGARYLADPYWPEHICGLQQGHSGQHWCHAVYRDAHRDRKAKSVRKPCGFHW